MVGVSYKEGNMRLFSGLALSYLIGSFPTGYLLGCLWNGMDI